jgi:hypothetical protein
MLGRVWTLTNSGDSFLGIKSLGLAKSKPLRSPLSYINSLKNSKLNRRATIGRTVARIGRNKNKEIKEEWKGGERRWEKKKKENKKERERGKQHKRKQKKNPCFL